MKFLKVILPFLILAAPFAGAEEKVIVPEQHDFSAVASKAHPRLIFNDKEFKQLKKDMKRNQYLKAMNESILALADDPKLRQTPLEYKLDVSGHRLLEVSRKALQRITVNAYAYRVTGMKQYLQAAEEDIITVCNFKDWHESHYLDVAEMSTAVAIGYDWLYKSLQPSTRELAVEKITEYAFGTSINAEKAPSFYKVVNNWNQVCNGGLICAALAIYESDPETASRAIAKSLASNRPIVSYIYAPDGAYPEGPGYWSYGTEYQLLMLTCLESCLGTDYGLSQEKGFMKTGYYKVFAKSNIGLNFNFSDAGSSAGVANGLWYFADRCNDPGLVYTELPINDRFAKGRFPFIAMKYAEHVGGSEITGSSAHLFSAQGVNPIVMARSGWTKDDPYLGLKAGSAGANHAHMDVGEFVYDAFGYRWAMDYSHPSYSKLEVKLKKYNQKLFDRKQNAMRWQIYGYNNRQHNTLTVNDKDHNVKGVAAIVDSFDEPGRIGGTVDFKNTFFDDLKSAVRTAAIRDGAYLEVTDDIATRDDAPARIRWTMVTPAKATVTDDGILLKQGNVTMKLVAEGVAVKYCTWPARPDAYDLPTKDFPAPGEKHTSLVGFEFEVPAAASVKLITTLKKQ